MSDFVSRFALGALAVVALVAFSWLAIAGATTASASQSGVTMTGVDHAAPAAPAAPAQVDDTSADDTRVPVMLWTLVAAGGAAGLALILLVVRLGLGWVKPLPPPEEDAAH